MFIGCCFYIVYFAEDSNDARSKLYVSCLLTIISVLLLAVWNSFYIIFCYKYPEITTEVGARVTKKAFVVWSLYLGTCLAFIWAYFLCVTRDYYEALMSYDDRKALKEKKKAGFFGDLVKIPGMNDDKKDDAPAMEAPKSPKMEADK
jgi:hypothetical protein